MDMPFVEMAEWAARRLARRAAMGAPDAREHSSNISTLHQRGHQYPQRDTGPTKCAQSTLCFNDMSDAQGGHQQCDSNGANCVAYCIGDYLYSADQMACINTMKDSKNCGSIGYTCPEPSHGKGACSSGVCSVKCDLGYVRSGSVCKGLLDTNKDNDGDDGGGLPNLAPSSSSGELPNVQSSASSGKSASTALPGVKNAAAVQGGSSSSSWSSSSYNDDGGGNGAEAEPASSSGLPALSSLSEKDSAASQKPTDTTKPSEATAAKEPSSEASSASSNTDAANILAQESSSQKPTSGTSGELKSHTAVSKPTSSASKPGNPKGGETANAGADPGIDPATTGLADAQSDNSDNGTELDSASNISRTNTAGVEGTALSDDTTAASATGQTGAVDSSTTTGSGTKISHKISDGNSHGVSNGTSTQISSTNGTSDEMDFNGADGTAPSWQDATSIQSGITQNEKVAIGTGCAAVAVFALFIIWGIFNKDKLSRLVKRRNTFSRQSISSGSTWSFSDPSGSPSLSQPRYMSEKSGMSPPRRTVGDIDGPDGSEEVDFNWMDLSDARRSAPGRSLKTQSRFSVSPRKRSFAATSILSSPGIIARAFKINVPNDKEPVPIKAPPATKFLEPGVMRVGMPTPRPSIGPPLPTAATSTTFPRHAGQSAPTTHSAMPTKGILRQGTPSPPFNKLQPLSIPQGQPSETGFAQLPDSPEYNSQGRMEGSRTGPCTPALNELRRESNYNYHYNQSSPSHSQSPASAIAATIPLIPNSRTPPDVPPPTIITVDPSPATYVRPGSVPLALPGGNTPPMTPVNNMRGSIPSLAGSFNNRDMATEELDDMNMNMGDEPRPRSTDNLDQAEILNAHWTWYSKSSVEPPNLFEIPITAEEQSEKQLKGNSTVRFDL